jgi:hypothetical protein
VRRFSTEIVQGMARFRGRYLRFKRITPPIVR